MSDEPAPITIERLLETPDLAEALEGERFKQFLDQAPIAVAVSELEPAERVIYANREFARLSGQASEGVLEGGWRSLAGVAAGSAVGTPPHALGDVLAKSEPQSGAEGREYLGAFEIPHGDAALIVDAWSTIIEDDDGKPAFRLVALVAAARREPSLLDELEAQVHEKDVQLQELQHRVKNNLQMITALIRVEARGVSDHSTGEGFDRLAGRVEALGLLYRALGASAGDGIVDLGIYLGEIATAVMRAHGTEGVHLDLQVDSWMASLNIAMPTGLVVNELLTNTLKHAFHGRDRGVIRLHSTTEVDGTCTVLVSDDGVGLPAGYSWPQPGKLSALIVRSLMQNADARMDVRSEPGQGMQVKIILTRADAEKRG